MNNILRNYTDDGDRSGDSDFNDDEHPNEAEEVNDPFKIEQSGRSSGSQENETAPKRKRKGKEAKKTRKKFAKIPLPSSFLNIGVKKGKVFNSENENEQKGRVRTVPHIEGNWATHVFIQIPLEEEMKNLIAETKLKLKRLVEEEINDWEWINQSDLHLSLSKTLYLRYEEIEPFVKNLRAELNAKNLGSISFSLKDFEVFVNEEKTRSFVGINVIDAGDIALLIESVDKAVFLFNKDVYYQNPQHHVSIGWAVGEKILKRDGDDTHSKKQGEKKLTIETDQTCEISSETVICKIGNKVFKIST